MLLLHHAHFLRSSTSHVLKWQQYIKRFLWHYWWNNCLDCSEKAWESGTTDQERKFVFMGMAGQDKGASYEASSCTMSTQVCTCKGYNTSWIAAVFGVCLLPLSQTASKWKMKIPTVMYHRLPADEAERGEWIYVCKQVDHRYGWEQSLANWIQKTTNQRPF